MYSIKLNSLVTNKTKKKQSKGCDNFGKWNCEKTFLPIDCYNYFPPLIPLIVIYWFKCVTGFRFQTLYTNKQNNI